jgi:hypothetical protein
MNINQMIKLIKCLHILKKNNIKKFDHNLSFRFIEAFLYYKNLDKTKITQILNDLNSDNHLCSSDLNELDTLITWKDYFCKLDLDKFTNEEIDIVKLALSNFISTCNKNIVSSDDGDDDDDDNICMFYN